MPVICAEWRKKKSKNALFQEESESVLKLCQGFTAVHLKMLRIL